MAVSCFLTYQTGEAQAFSDAGTLFASFGGVRSIELYTPVAARDPVLEEEVGPALIVQLRFDTVAEVEQAVGTDAFDRLVELAGPSEAPSIEVMAGTVYLAAGEPDMTTTNIAVAYLVQYRRSAPDEASFITHYCTHHAPIMALLPGLRRLEIYTSVGWSAPASLPRGDNMLICDTSFGSADALNVALQSDVRVRLREDYNAFPPFGGPVTHQGMRRTRVHPRP